MTLDLAVISGYDTEAKATEAHIDKWDCRVRHDCVANSFTMNEMQVLELKRNI